MTPEQAIAALKALDQTDPEAAHYDADEILCKLLTALGHTEVVEAYNAVEPKWYA
jgi:hypothetical protein